MSQAFTSKASEEKERKRAEPSIEVVQEWEEQLCAAHNAHRIAKVSWQRAFLRQQTSWTDSILPCVGVSSPRR